MPKAVLDVNVLISALLSASGAPARIVIEWRAGAFELIVSEALLAELARACANSRIRSRVTHDEVREFAALLRRDAVVAVEAADIDPAVLDDPDDDYLVALARASGADVIVTGDRQLLQVEGLSPVAVTPAVFLAGLRSLG